MGKRCEGIEKRPHSGLRHRKILFYVFDNQLSGCRSASCHALSYTLKASAEVAAAVPFTEIDV